MALLGDFYVDFTHWNNMAYQIEFTI